MASVARAAHLEEADSLPGHPELDEQLLLALSDLGVGVLVGDSTGAMPVNETARAMGPDVLDQVATMMGAVTHAVDVGRCEIAALDAGGHRIRVELALRPIDGGTRAVVVVRDVTQSKLVYDRERKRAEQLAALAQVAQGLTGTLDPDELLLAIADAARTVIGAGAAVLALHDDLGGL